MPDRRTHRGAHPEDGRLFAPKNLCDLRAAVGDFSLLLTKGYAEKSALKLVGDRFDLTTRQRIAVQRAVCSDQQLARRKKSEVTLADIAAQPLAIDGYNLLITVEAALSGAPIFIGRDQTYRDLAGIHGTYRKVQETVPAVQLIGAFLADPAPAAVHWYLDSPVSNSGRLKTLITEIAQRSGWPWNVTLLFNPDSELIKSDRIVATSDSVVLDACGRWVNLAAEIIKHKIPSAWVIDLSLTPGAT